MKHDWRESYNVDLTTVIFTCRKCQAMVGYRKIDCDVHSPDDDPEKMESLNISLDCHVEQVRGVMES